MALVRVFCKVDVQHKIILPRGVCKELKVKPGDKLELTVAGPNRAKKLVIAKKYIGGR